MDRAALATFRAVAEAGGVTRAAERLHCVPSAVTTRLKRLEAELGRPLFVRGPRGMALTAQGRVLMGYAERLEALFGAAERAVGRDDEPRGALRIGATDTAATVYLPRVFARYHEAHPDVALEVVSEVSEALVAAVRAQRLDCAIVNRAVAEPGLVAEAVRREQLVLVSALGITDPASLPEFTFLAARAGGAQRARIEAWWAQGARPPIRVIEMPSVGLRLSCAAAGMGITALPLSVLERLATRDTLRRHPIPEPWCRLDTYLVRRAEGGDFAALRRFRGILREEFDGSSA